MTDASGNTSTGTVDLTVTAVNDPPAASDQTASANEDANLKSPLDVTDPDSATLSYSLVSGTGKGSVTLNADGTFAFDPGSDFQSLTAGASEEVSFTYKVTDDFSASDTAMTAAGTIAFEDVDTGEDGATASSGTTKYGAWSVDASGAWSHKLDNDLASVQAVAAGTEVIDTFQVDSKDGSASQIVSITLTGSNDSPTVSGPVEAKAFEDDTVFVNRRAILALTQIW